MLKPSDRKQLDALALVTRTALRDRRRSPWIALGLVGLVVLLVVFLAWKFIPSVRYPQLLLTAYDVNGLPGEEVAVRAGIETSDPSLPENRLANVEVFLQVGQGEWQRAMTDSLGFVAIPAALPTTPGLAAITARYSGEVRKHRAVEAQARAFAWPADSKVVLVDLTACKSTTASESAEFQISPREAQALTSIGKTCKIAYWSSGNDSPAQHAKLRHAMSQAWMTAAVRSPMGPLLGQSAEVVGRHFAKRYPESVVGVTKSQEVADTWHAVGVRVIYIGTGTETSPGFRIAADWDACAAIIAKQYSRTP